MNDTERFDSIVGRIVQRLNYNDRDNVVAIARLLFGDEDRDTQLLADAVKIEDNPPRSIEELIVKRLMVHEP